MLPFAYKGMIYAVRTKKNTSRFDCKDLQTLQFNIKYPPNQASHLTPY